MPLDHSLESRLAYDRRTPIWPPPALQVDSKKIARKTSRFVSNVVKRMQKSPKSPQTEASNETPKENLPRRNLTLKEQHLDPENQTSTTTQSQSPLFRLPYSIRQRIYAEVLGNSNIHVTSIKGGQQLSHLRCKCATCPGVAFYIERGKWKREWLCDELKFTIETTRLHTQLLRTCRKIYSEAIEVLYASNTFSFKDAKVLQNFVNWALPQRHASITSIHVDLPASTPPASAVGPQKGNAQLEINNWNAAWDTLLNLPNLQTVQIRVHATETENAPPSNPKKLLEHTQQLGNVKSCLFYLPEDVVPEAWMKEAPFETASIKEWKWEHEFTRRPLTVF